MVEFKKLIKKSRFAYSLSVRFESLGVGSQGRAVLSPAECSKSQRIPCQSRTGRAVLKVPLGTANLAGL